MIDKTLLFIFVLTTLSLLLPSTLFAQNWAAETVEEESEQKSASQEGDEPYDETTEPPEVDGDPNIPLMAFAQFGGMFLSSLALALAGLFLFMSASNISDALAALSIIPIVAIPISWPFVTNKIGKGRGGGNHLGWSSAGAGVGLVSALGFQALAIHFESQRSSSNGGAEEVGFIAFQILAVAAPFISTIGGYHLGRSRAHNSTDTNLSLRPIIDRDHGVGASLNLSFSF